MRDGDEDEDVDKDATRGEEDGVGGVAVDEVFG